MRPGHSPADPLAISAGAIIIAGGKSIASHLWMQLQV